MMRRSPPGWRSATGSHAAPPRLCRDARAAAALRREPAPAGGLLHDGRGHRPASPPPRQHAGQGAELQQHQRHGRRLRAGGGVRPRRRPVCAIIKHANPAASPWARPGRGLRSAFDCDRTSAFGGIVALNRRSTPNAATRSWRSSPRSSSPPTPRARPRRSSREEEPAPADHRRPAARAPIAGS
jgi:hypothetical protein